MKKVILKTMMVAAVAMVFSSCTAYNHSMREPNTRINLTKSDFTLSEQITAEASCTKVFGIDFPRLFTKKTGNVQGGAAGISLASIPVLGSFVSDKTTNYALYELMNSKPGYDVVFYPQYETKVFKPFFGIGFVVKKTTVKATARLGKLNR
jgi:hypothetical protein